jgi:hypothetical protein
MKSLNQTLAVLLLSAGIGVWSATPMSASPNGQYQYGDRDGARYPERYGDLRSLVDRTQTDLRTSAELEHNNGDQRERYRNAQGHLSTFDRNLTKGHFDKAELDKAIHDVQSVLDHNALQASARDELLRDVQDLRAVRDHRY